MHAPSLEGRGSAAVTLRPCFIWGIIIVGMLIGGAASAATIFQENFAGGLGAFTASGSVKTGTFGARLRVGLSSAGQITSGVISATGFTDITLSFDRTTAGLDLGETAVASYSTDGVNFTQLEAVRTASGRVTLRLGARADNQSSLFLRFALNANSLLETYTVANIVLDGNASTDPGGAVLPPVSSIETEVEREHISTIERAHVRNVAERGNDRRRSPDRRATRNARAGQAAHCHMSLQIYCRH